MSIGRVEVEIINGVVSGVINNRHFNANLVTNFEIQFTSIVIGSNFFDCRYKAWIYISSLGLELEVAKTDSARQDEHSQNGAENEFSLVGEEVADVHEFPF